MAYKHVLVAIKLCHQYFRHQNKPFWWRKILSENILPPEGEKIGK